MERSNVNRNKSGYWWIKYDEPMKYHWWLASTHSYDVFWFHFNCILLIIRVASFNNFFKSSDIFTSMWWHSLLASCHNSSRLHGFFWWTPSSLVLDTFSRCYLCQGWSSAWSSVMRKKLAFIKCSFTNWMHFTTKSSDQFAWTLRSNANVFIVSRRVFHFIVDILKNSYLSEFNFSLVPSRNGISFQAFAWHNYLLPSNAFCFNVGLFAEMDIFSSRSRLVASTGNILVNAIQKHLIRSL